MHWILELEPDLLERRNAPQCPLYVVQQLLLLRCVLRQKHFAPIELLGWPAIALERGATERRRNEARYAAQLRSGGLGVVEGGVQGGNLLICP